MYYNLMYPVISVCIAIFVAILFFAKEKLVNNETKLYSNILIASLLIAVAESLTVFCNYFFPGSTLIEIFNRCAMILVLIWCATLFLYVYNLSCKKEKNYKTLAKWMTLINTIFIIVTQFLPFELINDNNTMTASGLSIYLMYGFIAWYLVLTIVLTILNSKRKVIKQYIPIYVLLFLAIVTLLLRIYVPTLVFVSTPLTFVTFIMYHTIENPDVKMIEQLNKAKKTAEKANLAKSDFLSSMSHEIRTPLNAIVGLSQDMLENKILPKELKEDTSDIVNASNTLLEIVGNIIDISKIESDKLERVELNYNIIEVVDSVMKVNEIRIANKDIKVSVTYAPDIPYELIGDKNHVKQVVNNLISNAYKYTESGSVKISLRCINNNNKCLLILSVEDTGKGIKEENISKLFTKFERLDAEKNSTVEGTGLGLAITQKLVKHLNGKINVKSSYGHGSLFVVQIPQKISIMEAPVIEKKDTNELECQLYYNKKVLIVDDNELNIKVARRALKDLNLTIEDSLSGIECLELIKNGNNYDLILMDIMMPELNGEQTLYKLKEIDGFNIPVVALTADATSNSKNKYIDMGFEDYIAKPFNKDQIRSVLDKIWRKK